MVLGTWVVSHSGLRMLWLVVDKEIGSGWIFSRPYCYLLGGCRDTGSFRLLGIVPTLTG